MALGVLNFTCPVGVSAYINVTQNDFFGNYNFDYFLIGVNDLESDLEAKDYCIWTEPSLRCEPDNDAFYEQVHRQIG
jgi:hypothetical protein